MRGKRAAANYIAAVDGMARAREEVEHGHASEAAMLLTHEGKVLKASKGSGRHVKTYKERYLVLREGVLTWYALEDLVVDAKNAYNIALSPLRGQVGNPSIRKGSIICAPGANTLEILRQIRL